MKINILVAVTLLATSGQVACQQGWQMKPVSIQTRWAKDVSPAKPLPEYPRPQLSRPKWTNLNGLWDYAITDSSQTAVKQFEGKILVPYPVESALSGVKKNLQPSQLLWYRRTINPSLKAGEKLLLHFGAVDYQSTVYLNGTAIGGHTGGYQSFSFDISDKLKDGENELLIKVWDPSDKGNNPHGKQVLNPGGIMYTPSSGIWQTVWMETVPEQFIAGLKLTPDVDGSNVKINVRSDADAQVVIETGETKITGKTNADIIIPVKNAKLWSPDEPYLYDVSVTLNKDVVKSYFGMRKIEVKKDAQGIDRIFLNNKYTYNLGTLDQGFWPDGLYTAPTDEALRFDIEAIKAMGFNTIRKHIKIEPARWYYYADKLGMLVWQDMVNPGGVGLTDQAKQQFEKESAENIAQLYNHPSIVTWVLFNEGWGEYDQARLAKWMKEQDPTRLVNGHSGAAIVDGKLDEEKAKMVIAKSENSDMTDIHSYPPPALPVHSSGKALVLGEFGGIGVQVHEHLWDDVASGWGYGGTVSGGQMKRNYQIMIDSLIAFEKRGLSASIYTQPFDVEAEQNGIMTYDREMVKIPFEQLRNIHQKLWQTTKNHKDVSANVKAKNIDTAAADIAVLADAYKKGRKDPVFLRRTALLALAEKNPELAQQAANDYIRQLKDPFTENNLKFITTFTRSTKDAGFSLLLNSPAKANAVLGEDKAESALTAAIETDEIKSRIKKGQKPDWATIQKNVVGKYGDLGLETLMQFKVFYTANHQDWTGFGQTIGEWFSRFGQKREWIGAGLINSLAWAAFENVSDPAVLEAVSKMTAHGLELEKEHHLMDTHANLLYRLGKTEEALHWQKQAVEKAPGDQEIAANYQKMKNGEPTWQINK